MNLTLIDTTITTLAQGKAFIEELYREDALFHFEDDAAEIGNQVDGQWVDKFTAEQAEKLNKRVEELYELDWSEAGHECPIGYALEVMGK